MKITIENNKLIYIYFQKPKAKAVEKTLAFVKSMLLFDEDGNWLGLRISNKYSDESSFVLPSIERIDFPIHKGEIIKNENYIEIIFDKNKEIYKTIEQECNIDINKYGIFGIEIIIWNDNLVIGKELIEKFIEYDI